MPVDRLVNLPAGADVFLDANIFIYSFSGQSMECRDLLRRCASENIFGVTTIEVINEVTHRLMLAEAVAKGVVTRQNAAALKGKWRDVARLSDYWSLTSRIFGLNILITGADESQLRRAQSARISHGLLTTDSLIVAAMSELGIDCLASRDGDFDHISSLTIYKPTDI